MRPARALAILAFFFAPSCLAQGNDAAVKEMARIQAESVAKHPVGAWIKAKDGKGQALSITVTEKTQGKDGWTVTTSLVSTPVGGKPGAPVKATTVQGSAAGLAKAGGAAPQTMVDETLTIAGKALACKVFTTKNGQKLWLSSEVPGGGAVKVLGPKGQVQMTVESYGDK